MNKSRSEGKDLFDSIFNSLIRKASTSLRWNGLNLIRSESLSQHINEMNAIGSFIIDKFGLSYEETRELKKEVFYRNAIHDLDESVYCDIPRSFKYKSESLRLEIEKTVDILLKENFTDQFIEDINSCKTMENLPGIIVKISDAFQATLKLVDEYKYLGNYFMKDRLLENIDILGNIVDDVRQRLDIEEYSFMSKELKIITEEIFDKIVIYLRELVIE